jgi:hypothetical protein
MYVMTSNDFSTHPDAKNEPSPSPKPYSSIDLVAPGETRIETLLCLVFSVDR